jgi:hypothetical protein
MEREDEIKAAAQRLCPTNIVKVEYFERGARWADEHPENNWRSVEDELPPDDDDVVVFDASHDCYIAWYDRGTWHNESDTITHWMPLPEPPEEFVKIKEDEL